MIHFCPSCGFNLTRDETLTLGDWVLTPSWTEYQGQRLRHAPASASILLYSIAAGRGQAVQTTAILNRLGSEASSNVISVYLSRLRVLLKAEGWPIPVKTNGRGGYLWVGS